MEMDPEGISKTVLMKFERRAMSGSMMDTYVKVVGSSKRETAPYQHPRDRARKANYALLT